MNSLDEKQNIRTDVAGEYSEKDSMCDMLRYVFIVKLQNFLIAPHTLPVPQQT